MQRPGARRLRPGPGGGTPGLPAGARCPPLEAEPRAFSAPSGAWAGQGPGFTRLGVPRPRPRGTGDTKHSGGASGLGQVGCGQRPPRDATASQRRTPLPQTYRIGAVGPAPSCAALGLPGNRVLRRPSDAASAPEELHLPQGTGPLFPRPVGSRSPCACVLTFLPSLPSPETASLLLATSRN